MTHSQGNSNSNRRRVSDLGSPTSPRPKPAPASKSQPRQDLPAVGNAVPKPHLKLPKALTVPPAVAPSKTDYQRNLAELLYLPNSAWSHRQVLQSSIGNRVLSSSKAMETRNFQQIAKQDLEVMAEAYDQQFFQGLCLPLARSYGLSFRLSSRMTRAGGKTTRTIFRGTRARPGRTHYEIALSTSLLFQSFRKPGDTIRVCGHECQDRLTAMQRIVEHEMIHLCEMLAWIQHVRTYRTSPRADHTTRASSNGIQHSGGLASRLSIRRYRTAGNCKSDHATSYHLGGRSPRGSLQQRQTLSEILRTDPSTPAN